MKCFPYNWIESGFIILVMVLPFVCGVVWRRETFGGFLGQLAISMAICLGLWAGIVFLICRRDGRKDEDDEFKDA